MAKIADRITKIAFEVLKGAPEGIRYAELVRRISSSDDKLKTNTIHGTVWNLDQRFPSKVDKPSRGLLRLKEFMDKDTDQLRDDLVAKPPAKVSEDEFYAPFADWIQNDLEECTLAIPLGRNKFRDKWGTPDVIGKRESKRSDIMQAPVEIVSAEIKPEVSQLVTAFGQACAYCLFSHKSYLVVPRQSPQDELARLDSLCQVFGIGLVLFDSAHSADPGFEIRARARRREPDLFYSNKYLKLIEADLFA